MKPVIDDTEASAVWETEFSAQLDHVSEVRQGANIMDHFGCMWRVVCEARK